MAADDASIKLGLVLNDEYSGTAKHFKTSIENLKSAVDFASKKMKEKTVEAMTSLGKNLPKAFVGATGAITVAFIASVVLMTDKLAKMRNQFASMDDSRLFFYELSKAAVDGRVNILTLTNEVEQLGRTGFRGTAKDMAQFSVMLHQFSQVTGIGVDQVASLVSNLSRFGQIGSDAAKSILNDWSDVRSTFKMSSSEAEELFTVTEKAAMHLAAFMVTMDAEKIKSSTMQLARFGGMMHEAGLTSETTSNILQALFQPSKWMQNAFLMTQMGYSINDLQRALVNGELPNAGTMFTNLANTAKRFYEMSKYNPFLMERYAKTLGMSVTEMARLGKMTSEEISKMAKLKDSAQSLDQAWQKLGESTTQIRILMNTLFNLFVLGVTPIVQLLNLALTPIAVALQGLLTLAGKFPPLMILLQTTLATILGSLILTKITLIANGVAALFASGAMNTLWLTMSKNMLMFKLSLPIVSALMLGFQAMMMVWRSFNKEGGILKHMIDDLFSIFPPFGGATEIVKKGVILLTTAIVGLSTALITAGVAFKLLGIGKANFAKQGIVMLNNAIIKLIAKSVLLQGVIGGVTTAIKVMGTVVLANPLTWWIVGIGAATYGVIKLYQHWDEIIDKVISKHSKFNKIGKDAKQGFLSGFSGIGVAITNAIVENFSSIVEKIKSLASSLVNIILGSIRTIPVIGPMVAGEGTTTTEQRGNVQPMPSIATAGLVGTATNFAKRAAESHPAVQQSGELVNAIAQLIGIGKEQVLELRKAGIGGNKGMQQIQFGA